MTRTTHPVAQLVDNMDDVKPEVVFRPVSHPDREQRLDYDDDAPIRTPRFGVSDRYRE